MSLLELDRGQTYTAAAKTLQVSYPTLFTWAGLCMKDGQFLHSYDISTLVLPFKGVFLHLYDARGGAEVEHFRSDKNGLSMEARRKHSF